ncbi:hypothetical protein Tco_0666466 [Tanacetum coccineum]
MGGAKRVGEFSPYMGRGEVGRQEAGGDMTRVRGKCYADELLAIALDEIQINDKLNFIEEQVEIMDHEVKQLKQIHILIVKGGWNSRKQ